MTYVVYKRIGTQYVCPAGGLSGTWPCPVMGHVQIHHPLPRAQSPRCRFEAWPDCHQRSQYAGRLAPGSSHSQVLESRGNHAEPWNLETVRRHSGDLFPTEVEAGLLSVSLLVGMSPLKNTQRGCCAILDQESWTAREEDLLAFFLHRRNPFVRMHLKVCRAFSQDGRDMPIISSTRLLQSSWPQDTSRRHLR